MTGLRVGFNDFISARGTSGSSVAASVIRESVAEDIDMECVDLGSGYYRAGKKVRNFSGMVWWDFWGARGSASRSKVDVMINTANTGMASKLPVVNVLHDVMVLDHPRYFAKSYVQYSRLTFGPSVKGAAVNVLPSIRSYERAKRRWPGATFEVIPWPVTCVRRDAPRQYPFSQNVLCVASGDRHKRVPETIEAVAIAKRSHLPNLSLTLICRNGNDNERIRDATAEWSSEFGSDSIFLTSCRVPDTDLARLYESAFCVILGSIDEGFGLPVLEAAAYGTPVVHSGGGAMSEVVPLHPSFDVKEGADGGALLELLVEQIVRLSDRLLWEQESLRIWSRSAGFTRKQFADSWHRVLAGL